MSTEDPKVTDRAYVTGFFEGDRGGYLRALAELHPFMEGLRNASAGVFTAIDALRLVDRHLAEQAAKMQRKPTKAAAPERDSRALPAIASASTSPGVAPSPTTPRRAPAAQTGNSSLSGPQRAVLQALAWWAALGHDTVSRAQLAAKVGWSVTGGHFLNRLSELNRLALISYPARDTVAFTPEGQAAAPAPDLAASLIDSIRDSLSGPQNALFDAMLAKPGTTTRDDLAEAVGWDAKGGHFLNRLSELSRLEIITYPARGEVALQPWIR